MQLPEHELRVLTDTQWNLHYVEKSEKIASAFYKAYTKLTWYSSQSEPMECVGGGSTLTFYANQQYHLLAGSFMTQLIPRVEIKKEYRTEIRICWPKNLISAMIKEATLRDDVLTYQTWDGCFVDALSQWNERKGEGMRNNRNVCMGNISALCEWQCEALPEYEAGFEQPWYYGDDPGSAYPLYTRDSQKRLEHRYKRETNIGKLLRVQKKVDGTWVNVQSPVEKKMYVVLGKESMPDAVLYGEYIALTTHEISNYAKMPEGERIYYIRDVVAQDAAESKGYGGTAEVKYKGGAPCVAIFWMLENVTAAENSNFSNYTTNADNMSEGYSPIGWTTIAYGVCDKKLHENTPSLHFLLMARKHCRSAPDSEGYNAKSFPLKLRLSGPEVAVNLGKLDTTISCLVKDGDINFAPSLIDPDGVADKASGRDKFILRVRFLTSKRFTVRREERGYVGSIDF